jgi:hypothetical protein
MKLHLPPNRRRFYGTRPAIKTAILATDSTAADYGRLHASLTEGSPINVPVFKDHKEAAQWLDVPLELLSPKGAATQQGDQTYEESVKRQSYERRS